MSLAQADILKGEVLIVDDTPANLRLLSQMLAQQGYLIRPVPNGPLALAAIQAEPPDLILLDIRMPGMNGYEVCEQLKADVKTRDIPIIFISALDAIRDKVKAFTIGGVDYITKPFQVEEVLARVETHLSLRNLQKKLQDANQRMEQELTLAGELQASFLPNDLPVIPGWQMTAMLRPARETSGDFYDFITLPNERLGIVVADVCDKGAGAALYMALSWTLLRTYAVSYPAQPEMVLSAVNGRIMKDTSANCFVTVFYGVLDLETGIFEYCNAGHCPPYLVSPHDSGNVRQLIRTGIPLGIYEDESWKQGKVQITPGDVLVLYTDGITEAENGQGGYLGDDRLLERIRTNLGQPARDIQAAILTEIQSFVGETSLLDDIALIVLHRDSTPYTRTRPDRDDCLEKG